MWVRPDSRGRGVGSALWEFLGPIAAERGTRRLTSRIDSKDEPSLRWLAARGATTGGTHLESKLELGADLPLFPPPARIAVETLPAEAGENELQAVHEAHVRLMRDTPNAETNWLELAAEAHQFVGEPPVGRQS